MLVPFEEAPSVTQATGTGGDSVVGRARGVASPVSRDSSPPLSQGTGQGGYRSIQWPAAAVRVMLPAGIDDVGGLRLGHHPSPAGDKRSEDWALPKAYGHAETPPEFGGPNPKSGTAAEPNTTTNPSLRQNSPRAASSQTVTDSQTAKMP